MAKSPGLAKQAGWNASVARCCFTGEQRYTLHRVRDTHSFRILRRRRILLLLHVLRDLPLRGLEIAERLLQAGHGRLQRIDLASRGIQLLLVIKVQLGDRLLEEIDIALEAAGAALHGLLDGADL